MKLADYLRLHGIKRNAFAARIEVAPSYVTALCDGACWPSREVVSRIIAATNGAVSADDFLPASSAA